MQSASKAMGEHKIEVTQKGEKKAKFIEHLLDDIIALEQMINDGIIEKEPIRIGAEQEFCIVDNDWTPSAKAMEILERINDPHFTTELGLYNLEINLDPIKLEGSCLSDLMRTQLNLLRIANEVCADAESRVLLCGILPTISGRHIQSEYMTPSPRYAVLNEMMRKLKGSDFSLHIMGADELSIMHESVLFEACNTSYQIHLQINPDDFVQSYNWAQAIAGPILGISTNAPLLLGKELWSETRIALFQQSIDTRSTTYSLRQNEPRVTFGSSWAKDIATDIYKDDISNFKLLLSKDLDQLSTEQLQEGRIPKLDALSLHNGTIYRWNRACYGVGGGKPHLRIENRYIPSGPTVLDEIANAAFWIGLMIGRPAEYDNMEAVMDFADAKSNFIRAARNGKASQMTWMGSTMPVTDLVSNILLPISTAGLRKAGIDDADIDLFLGVIEKRIVGYSGSEWQIFNLRRLRKALKVDDALRVLCAKMYDYQQKNIPVGDWENIDINQIPDIGAKAEYVYEKMTTMLFTVNEDDPINLVKKLMDWNNIHHVPVENDENELVGILTDKMVSDNEGEGNDLLPVKDIMGKHVITVKKDETLQFAEELMIRNGIGSLPVVRGKELVGILTKKDILNK